MLLKSDSRENWAFFNQEHLLNDSLSVVLIQRIHKILKNSLLVILRGILLYIPAAWKLTITQKMADQGRSDLDVILTMILCATNILFGKLWSSYSQISLK